MISDYAEWYGDPDPDMSWFRFLLLVNRTERLEARAILRMMDATFYSAAKVHTSDTGQLDAYRSGLARVAYPKGERDG